MTKPENYAKYLDKYRPVICLAKSPPKISSYLLNMLKKCFVFWDKISGLKVYLKGQQIQ